MDTPSSSRAAGLEVPSPFRSNPSPIRSSTVPSPTTPSSVAHKPRLRSRTSTVSFVNPLPVVMSRENSLEGGEQVALPRPTSSLGDYLSRSYDEREPVAGPSRLNPPPSTERPIGRKASKSVSSSRPPLASAAKRTKSYHQDIMDSPLFPLKLSSPVNTKSRSGLKRRTSTPHLAVQQLTDEEDPTSSLAADPPVSNSKAGETRARATSTSIATPQSSQPNGPTVTIRPQHLPPLVTPQSAPPWADIYVTPASPENEDNQPIPAAEPAGVLTAMYDVSESSLKRILSFFRPPQHRVIPRRRDSETDSEKGLDTSEEDATMSTNRTSEDSLRRGGRYWGLWASRDGEDHDSGYFSLPPTPPDERKELNNGFSDGMAFPASLPTPALSATSLSRGDSKRRKKRWTGAAADETTEGGWLSKVGLTLFSSSRRSGKTSEVLKELGWTVGILVGMFFITGAVALWMIQGMPITQLKRLPSSTTDLQLLSAEIRAYMSSSDSGYWHTVGVLTFVGCWKHAWSVPGAVILNILVGSVLEPMAALVLLTIITASGSLGSYMLSRPLAPLIAVLFPKPLALVRAALAPEAVPSPPSASTFDATTVTPIQVGPAPAQPIGGETKPTIWRRLLIMRAMGFVPWSGMNVACGVVGVDWKTFWLTTAAGSASWSYVTASVGNILSRLTIPQSALQASAAGLTTEAQGESLTSLLRDPVLIAKLVFLTGLTLLPVVLKRRSGSTEAMASIPGSPEFDMSSVDSMEAVNTTPKPISSRVAQLMHGPNSPPLSPLTQSLARFTPTPRAFDLLSFGRTAMRQGGRVVLGGVRGASEGLGRLAGAPRA